MSLYIFFVINTPGAPGESRLDMLRTERIARRQEFLWPREHGGENCDEAIRREYR